MLDTRPLFDAYLANIFSHSVGCLFTLLIVSFPVQKLFCLIRSHLLFLIFVTIAFGIFVIAFPRLSSRISVVLGFTFKCFIHLELIFVYIVRKKPNFNLLHLASQLSQHHLLNRNSFLHCSFLSTFSKIR